jgi:cytochrome c-type biogenesis protein CcmH/NrfG
VRVRGGCAVMACALVACSAAVRSPPPTQPLGRTVAALAAAVDESARRSEHEPDARIRTDLATQAARDAEECVSQAPEAAACQYARSIALGLDAREHPLRATTSLTDMLASLARAESADPHYDSAGPARVRALVLTRAPPWPLGPGDPEEGLSAAQRAVALNPEHPPNWLALAEAQAKTGATSEAQASYEHARDVAQALPASRDRDDWLAEAQKALAR